MASAGIIDITMRAITEGFAKGVDQSKKSLESLGSALTSTKALMVEVAGAIAVGAAVHQFVEMAKTAADSIDTIGKLSDRLGTTTEALIGAGHGARLAGVNMEEFGDMLEKMRKRLAEVAMTGEGPAGKAMAHLGLSATKLANMDAIEALKLLSDEIAGIANPGERAALAVDLFGKSGMKMLNFLSEGSSGIEEMTEDAKKLGITFSDMDFRKVEDANDAWTRVKEAVEGLTNQVVIGLAPALKVVADHLAALIPQGKTLATALIPSFESVSKMVIDLGNGFLEMSAKIADALATVQRASEKLTEFMMRGALGPVGQLIDIPGLDAGSKALEGIAAGARAAKTPMAGVAAWFAKIRKELDAASNPKPRPKVGGDIGEETIDMGGEGGGGQGPHHKHTKDVFAGALEFGSAEANKSIAYSMGLPQNKTDDAVKQGVEVAKQQLVEVKGHRQTTKEILDAVKKKFGTTAPIKI